MIKTIESISKKISKVLHSGRKDIYTTVMIIITFILLFTLLNIIIF